MKIVALMVAAALAVAAATPASACSVDIGDSASISDEGLWSAADSVILAQVKKRTALPFDRMWVEFQTIALINGKTIPERWSAMYYVGGGECAVFPHGVGYNFIAYVTKDRPLNGWAPWPRWNVLSTNYLEDVSDPRIATGLRAAADRMRSQTR